MKIYHTNIFNCLLCVQCTTSKFAWSALLLHIVTTVLLRPSSRVQLNKHIYFRQQTSSYCVYFVGRRMVQQFFSEKERVSVWAETQLSSFSWNPQNIFPSGAHAMHSHGRIPNNFGEIMHHVPNILSFILWKKIYSVFPPQYQLVAASSYLHLVSELFRWGRNSLAGKSSASQSGHPGSNPGVGLT